MDEVDALCPRRDSGSSSQNDQERRVVSTLLSMIDSIPNESRIIVIGVTNRYYSLCCIYQLLLSSYWRLNETFVIMARPDSLDPALRRPGRLDRELEIRVPSVSERKEILHVLLGKIPNHLTEADVSQLAADTHGFVGADLSLLCREACLAATKRIIHSSKFIPDDTALD